MSIARGFLIFSVLAISLVSALPAKALDGGRYGNVRIVAPTGENRGYVVFFSDIGGWTDQDDQVLAGLAADGALVIGVDTALYIKTIAPAKKKCDQLVGDVESLSRQVQREHSGAQYQFPILAGIGAGGTLAGAILAEAPPNTLAGAVSIDPAVSLKTAHPLCPGAPAVPDQHGAFRYGPIATLSGFWMVDLTSAATAAERANINALRQAHTPLDLVDQQGTVPDMLVQLIEPRLTQPQAGSIADLPLIELPVDPSDQQAADHPAGLMAVVMSGDGGWRDLDKTIAENLQKNGIPVVGWDCLRYFWRQKTPEQTAADLTDVLETYSAKWHATKIALVGFSFGADVIPFAYDLLPKAVQRHVVLVSLLAFETKADWEISVSGWLGAPPSDDAIPVEPAIAKMPAHIIQCLYGQDEEDTACPSLAARGADVVQTTGGHHFDGDYDALSDRILEAFRARAAS